MCIVPSHQNTVRWQKFVLTIAFQFIPDRQNRYTQTQDTSSTIITGLTNLPIIAMSFTCSLKSLAWRTQQTSIHEIEKTETERNPASISRHKYRRKLATRIGLTEAGDTHRLDRSSSYIWQKGGVTQRLERTQFMYIIQSWWHSQTGQKSDSTHRLYRKLCHRSQAV